MPFPCFKRMSVMMTSGCRFSMPSIASSSDSANPTTSKWPSADRLSMIRLRIIAESSTTKTRSRRPIGSSKSADQVVAQRISRELRVALEVHLFQDSRAVRADRLHAQAQLPRDVRHGFSRCQLDEDLELPIRQLPVQRLRGVASGFQCQHLGKRRTYVLLPFGDGAQSVEHVFS